jgi:hypothetical protein
MIIFAAQPNRFFPHLVEDIYTKTSMSHFEMSYFLKSADKKSIYLWYDAAHGFYSLDEAKQHAIPTNKDFKFNLTENFGDFSLFTGTFNPNFIQKNNNDFMLSMVGDPVARVYEIFYFIKLERTRKTYLHNEIDPKIYNLFFGPDVDALTLEQYVDIFIENNGVFERDNICMCKNLIRQFESVDNLDFVCTDRPGSFARGIEVLNDLLKVDLKVDNYINYIKPVSSDYRLQELREILKLDIELFEYIDSL